MSSKKNKIPKSVFGRATKLMSVGANVLGKEIGGRLSSRMKGEQGTTLNTKVQQAKELVVALGQMKGAAMKVGQFLSIEMSDLLPDEVTSVLRQLHDELNH